MRAHDDVTEDVMFMKFMSGCFPYSLMLVVVFTILIIYGLASLFN